MRKITLLLLKILVSIFFVWLLVHNSKLDFALLPQLFNSPTKLAITILLYFIVVSISTWRWHQLNEVQNIKLSYSKTILPTYLGIAFNNLLPGGVGGDFYRFYYLNKAQAAKKSAVMLSILIDRIIGLLGMVVIACAAIFIQAYRYSNSIPSVVLTISCSSLLLGIAFSLASYHYLLKNDQFRNWITATYPNQRLASLIISVLNALAIYSHSKKTILKCLLASVAIQLLITVTCLFIANLMHYPQISIISYLLAVSITQLVNLIPIAPGGLGVGEIAFANILILLNPGISASYATIFLAYRIIGIFTYLPALGFFMLGKETNQNSKLNANEITI